MVGGFGLNSERNCELSHPKACNSYGVCYALGVDGKKDLTKAIEAFSHACPETIVATYHDAAACFNLAISYEKGYGVKQNNKMARKYYKYACASGGDAEVCRKAYNILE
jgi:TPR repeat protein